MRQTLHQLRVPVEVAELIRKMHPHLKSKVKAALKMLLADPNSGKALKDALSGLRSFRVSRFRIIYRLSQKKEIEIVAIGPRVCIYEETFRLLEKEKKKP